MAQYIFGGVRGDRPPPRLASCSGPPLGVSRLQSCPNARLRTCLPPAPPFLALYPRDLPGRPAAAGGPHARGGGVAAAAVCGDAGRHRRTAGGRVGRMGRRAQGRGAVVGEQASGSLQSLTCSSRPASTKRGVKHQGLITPPPRAAQPGPHVRGRQAHGAHAVRVRQQRAATTHAPATSAFRSLARTC
jgi:hypothetical protein